MLNKQEFRKFAVHGQGLRAYPENKEVVAERENFGVTTPNKFPVAPDYNRIRSYHTRRFFAFSRTLGR
uniref:hypothetical protein n=1 Tax=Hymenobacter sp. IS2118 TaxID=1505605 RepID=UPI001F2EB596